MNLLRVGQVRQVTEESLSLKRFMGRKFIVKAIHVIPVDRPGDEHEMTFVNIIWDDGMEATDSHGFLELVSVEV